MNITVTCVSCGQKLSAPENSAGRRVPCPKCKAPVDVPAVGAMAREPAMAVPQVVPEPRPAVAQSSAARLNPMPPAMPSRSVDPDLVDLGLAEPATPSISARSTARPSRGVTAPMIAVAVLLLLAGRAIGGFLMLTGKSGAGSDLKYLPDDPDFIVSADVSGMISSGAGQKLKGRADEMLAAFNKGMTKDSKFKPEDVGRITFGAKVQDKKAAGVIHFIRPVNEQDVPPMARGTKKAVGQYQIVVDGDAAFCQIDPQTIVTGDEDSVRKVLERNGPARVSDELTEAMSEVDFSKSLAIAGSLKNLGNMAGPGGMPMGPMAMPGMKDIRCGALQADVGNDIRLKAVLLCKDATTADQLKKMADGGLSMAKMSASNPNLPPEAARSMKILDTLEISNSGAAVRASLTIDVDTILGMIPARFGQPMEQSAINTGPAEQAPAGAPFGNPRGPKPLTAAPFQAPSGPAQAKQPMPFGPQRGRPASGIWQVQASNNLKQIVLAMRAYSDKENHFPPAAICDSHGKPLLSWRVAIMPYLSGYEQSLYKQIHLSEPWDSAHNKFFINMMPSVYGSPGGRQVARGKTCILAPVGETYAFSGSRGRRTADFTDGLSNTVLVVEAAPEGAVEWTRPADLVIDESDPVAGLFGTREGGVLAGFADGAVKFIPQSTGKDVLHALFTINGGEAVPTDF